MKIEALIPIGIGTVAVIIILALLLINPGPVLCGIIAIPLFLVLLIGIFFWIKKK